MRISLPLIAATTVAFLMPLNAQEIVDTWQGSLQAGAGIRTVVRIYKSEDGTLKGKFYAIDQTTEGVQVSSISFKDSVLRFTIDLLHGSYEGKLGADKNSLSGSWTQGQTWPLSFQRATKETAWVIDPSPHTVQFVATEKDVKLEVLDWGGSGRPLLVLAGLGSTAHDFDQFAPKLTPAYHVYGITRRGFGESGAPKPQSDNYSADRLGDDVLAVMDALKINKPVIAGHSIAGEELSSIGTRVPDRVAGLIYLEAGNPYAYYDDHVAQGESATDSAQVREELQRLFDPITPKEQKTLLKHLLEVSLPRLQRDLVDAQKNLQSIPDGASGPPDTLDARVGAAIMNGEEIFTGVTCPVLAIFAVPHATPSPLPGMDEAARKAADLARMSAQADAFEAGNPSAHVVRIANADHFIFRSNEADVLREINAFLAKLP